MGHLLELVESMLNEADYHLLDLRRQPDRFIQQLAMRVAVSSPHIQHANDNSNKHNVAVRDALWFTAVARLAIDAYNDCTLLRQLTEAPKAATTAYVPLNVRTASNVKRRYRHGKHG